MKTLLISLITAAIMVIEVVGVVKFYPKCEDSIWKLFLFYLSVYISYETFRIVKNYYNTF